MSGGDAKASSSFGTGFLPFAASFTCTWHHLKAGCFAELSVDFDEYDSAQGYYPWRGRQPGGLLPIDIAQAEIHLSGIQLNLDFPNSVNPTMPFAEWWVDAQTVDIQNNVVKWYVWVNWRDDPSTMIDEFEVKVVGEVVWSTNVDSRIWTQELDCDGKEENCSASATLRTGVQFPIVGAAIGMTNFQLIGTPHEVSGFGGSVDWQPASPGDTTVTSHCALYYDAPPVGPSQDMWCQQRVILLGAKSTEAEPFVSGPFVGGGAQGTTLFTTQFQAQPGTSAHREMACGLREFDLQVSGMTPTAEKFGGLFIGADWSDCGMNGPGRGYAPGGWSYGGPMFHGLKVHDPASSSYPPVLQDYVSHFVLDGAKLVWP